MHLDRVRSPNQDIDFHSELVARSYRFTKFGPLNTGKDHELLFAFGDFRKQQRAARLRDGLDHQHAGHDRISGKVSHEIRFIHGDVLDGDNAFFALDLDDTVDEQKGVAMRQDGLDGGDVQGLVFALRLRLNGGDTGSFFAHMPKREIIVSRQRSLRMRANDKLRSMISVADARAHEKEFLSDLKALVEIESPSSDKPALDHLAEFLAARLEHHGAHAQIHVAEQFGNHVQADFAGVSESKPVLLLGHTDTVWETGTLKQIPFRIADGRAWGPGVLDMKGGIAIAIHAMALMHEHRIPHAPVRMLFVSDEEVGSHSSRAITEKLALESQAALVLEPGQGLDGSLKTERKGVGVYQIKVTGEAAHAGVDPGKGASAIHELAHQIEILDGFTNLERGLTVNAGIIRGGTRSNVIAAEAWAEVDVRVRTTSDGKIIDSKMRALRARDPRCNIAVSGGINRPPMERTEKVVALYKKAEQVAGSLGLKIDEQATGGGSDGNFTAALGVPTLDGLGVVGEGAHAINESILLNQIAPRLALLAGLIASL